MRTSQSFARRRTKYTSQETLYPGPGDVKRQPLSMAYEGVWKKHTAGSPAVRWNTASAKTEQSLERPCPSMSVVLGHVDDIGSASHYVAVPPDRDDQPVREFESFTKDMVQLADWLVRCGVDIVAMRSTGYIGFRCLSCWNHAVLRSIWSMSDTWRTFLAASRMYSTANGCNS